MYHCKLYTAIEVCLSFIYNRASTKRIDPTDRCGIDAYQQDLDLWRTPKEFYLVDTLRHSSSTFLHNFFHDIHNDQENENRERLSHNGQATLQSKGYTAVKSTYSSLLCKPCMQVIAAAIVSFKPAGKQTKASSSWTAFMSRPAKDAVSALLDQLHSKQTLVSYFNEILSNHAVRGAYEAVGFARAPEVMLNDEPYFFVLSLHQNVFTIKRRSMNHFIHIDIGMAEIM